MKKNDERLCVLISSGPKCFALAHDKCGDRRFSGKIRTYLPDCLDDDLKRTKFAKSPQSLVKFLDKNKQVQVIAKVADVRTMTGWKSEDFSPAI